MSFGRGEQVIDDVIIFLNDWPRPLGNVPKINTQVIDDVIILMIDWPRPLGNVPKISTQVIDDVIIFMIDWPRPRPLGNVHKIKSEVIRNDWPPASLGGPTPTTASSTCWPNAMTPSSVTGFRFRFLS